MSADAHIVLMGVAGAGKSTVGAALAARLGRRFVEGDDFHPARNIATMAAGEGLGNADRDAWIAALSEALNAGPLAVASCSALNATVRWWLAERTDAPLCFVQLDVPREVLAARLRARRGHFAGPRLLDSQLDALDVPADAVRVDADGEAGAVLDRVVEALERAT